MAKMIPDLAQRNPQQPQRVTVAAPVQPVAQLVDPFVGQLNRVVNDFKALG